MDNFATICWYVLLAMASKSLADEYLGDFCWQVIGFAGESLWNYQFGVYRKQGGHIALYGSIDYGTNGVSAAHGNAILVSDNVKMTIISSDYEATEGEVWGDTFTAILNATTLSGEWNALSLETVDGVTVRSFVEAGSMNLTSCQ